MTYKYHSDTEIMEDLGFTQYEYDKFWDCVKTVKMQQEDPSIKAEQIIAAIIEDVAKEKMLQGVTANEI